MTAALMSEKHRGRLSRTESTPSLAWILSNKPQPWARFSNVTEIREGLFGDVMHEPTAAEIDELLALHYLSTFPTVAILDPGIRSTLGFVSEVEAREVLVSWGWQG